MSSELTMASIQSGFSFNPPRILIYGLEGIGKSTFANGLPNPVFLPPEDGLDNVNCEKFPYYPSYDDIFKAIDLLTTQKHNYRTLVIDTVDAMERLINKKVCKDHNVKNIEKVLGGYGKGYSIALEHWQELIERLTQLRFKRRMAIVLSAHASIENYSDPDTSFIRFAPRLNKKVCGIICENVDLILHATRRGGAAKGEDGGERIVKMDPSRRMTGKRRYFTMPTELPMKPKVVMAAIEEHQRRLASGEFQEPNNEN